ncbi:hypothetical protein Tco_0787567 [Tanacetum coccineum]
MRSTEEDLKTPISDPEKILRRRTQGLKYLPEEFRSLYSESSSKLDSSKEPKIIVNPLIETEIVIEKINTKKDKQTLYSYPSSKASTPPLTPKTPKNPEMAEDRRSMLELMKPIIDGNGRCIDFPTNSIHSWEEMVTKFLTKYFPLSKTTKLTDV